MLRYFFMTIFLMLWFVISYAQLDYYVFHFRNFQNSLSFSSGNGQNQSYVLKSYGELVLSSNLPNHSKYIYQGQEFDEDLEMNFFSSRIYQVSNKRFLQPDPASQYFSPYLFVGADPVNIIDLDGNEGKPLVLYANDYDNPMRAEGQFFDLQSEIGDAHYMPISKFMQGDLTKLENWNRNVFIDGHTGTNSGMEILAESSRDITKIKMLPEKFGGIKGVNRISINGGFVSSLDGKSLGNRLREFAEVNGVGVDNVVLGGCEGTHAAKSIGEGYIAKGGDGSGKLTTMGLKEGNWQSVLGEFEAAQSGLPDLNFKGTRMYVHDGKREITANVKKKLLKGRKEVTSGYKYVDGRGSVPYIEGPQIRDFANARVAKELDGLYDIHPFAY